MDDVNVSGHRPRRGTDQSVLMELEGSCASSRDGATRGAAGPAKRSPSRIRRSPIWRNPLSGRCRRRCEMASEERWFLLAARAKSACRSLMMASIRLGCMGGLFGQAVQHRPHYAPELDKPTNNRYSHLPMQLTDSSTPLSPSVEVLGPSLALDLSWCIHAAHSGYLRAVHPVLARLYDEHGDLLDRILSFWSDGMTCCTEAQVMAHHAGAISVTDFSTFRSRTEATVRSMSLDLELASESGEDPNENLGPPETTPAFGESPAELLRSAGRTVVRCCPVVGERRSAGSRADRGGCPSDLGSGSDLVRGGDHRMPELCRAPAGDRRTLQAWLSGRPCPVRVVRQGPLSGVTRLYLGRLWGAQRGPGRPGSDRTRGAPAPRAG